MTQISILGCGWLGFPLAKALLKDGFLVKGSTTSIDKLTELKAVCIDPFLIALDSKRITGAIEDFLNQSSTLVLNIPPQLRGDNNDASIVEEMVFVKKIKKLIPFIEKSTIENVLFVSSTSVYGETNEDITEETPVNPDSESGKQLSMVEELLQNNISFKTTIVRFGGLIGNDRHPIHFLAGKENVENPDAPINLIHQQDCIGIILKIINEDFWNETFNAVAPFHPSRREYYIEKAKILNLALPKFNYNKPSIGKTIISTKIETVLHYTFTKRTL